MKLLNTYIWLYRIYHIFNWNISVLFSSRGGGGYRGGGGGYERRDHGGYRGGGGHDRYRRSPSPYHRRDDYRRRSRSRSYSPRKFYKTILILGMVKVLYSLKNSIKYWDIIILTFLLFKNWYYILCHTIISRLKLCMSSLLFLLPHNHYKSSLFLPHFILLFSGRYWGDLNVFIFTSYHYLQ